jgi:parallel beta-helix repeat protein
MYGATINQADVPATLDERVFANSDSVGGNSNITIQGGKITGDILFGLSFTNVTNLRVSDMEFDSVGLGRTVYGVAVKVWSGTGIIIKNNYIHHGRTGIYVNNASGIIVADNLLYNQFYIGAELSIDPLGNDTATVSGNIFDTCAKALLLLCSSRVSIVGNSFKNSSKMNIEVITGETDNNANYNTIVGNTISGGSGRGINVVYSHYNTIADNNINGIAGNVTSEGIFLESSDKNVVTGNNLHQIGGHGISIGGNDNLITGNRIENASYGNPDVWSGIAVTGKNVLISDNMIRDYAGNAWAGIRVREGSEGVVVKNNDLRDSGNAYPLYDEGVGTIALLNVVD